MRWKFWERRAPPSRYESSEGQRAPSPSQGDTTYGGIQTVPEREEVWKDRHVQALEDLGYQDPYVAKYLKLLRTHVVGVDGIRLRIKSEEDPNDNDQQAWQEWYERAFRLPYVVALKLIVTAVARDGELFLVADPEGDELYYRIYSAGAIPRYQTPDRAGKIDYDDRGRPLRYTFAQAGGELVVPAEAVIHIFNREEAGQKRGESWLLPAIQHLRRLANYEDATATREVDAAKDEGHIELDPATPVPDPGVKGENPLPKEMEGRRVFLPGAKAAQSPRGEGFDAATIGTTKAAMIATVANALNISFPALASDPSSGNMSSLRMLNQDDMAMYRDVQHNVVKDQVILPLYETWRKWYAGGGRRAARLATATMRWQYPGFAYIDPSKEATARKTNIEAGVLSKRTAITQMGLDPDIIMAEIEEERADMVESAPGESDAEADN